MSFTKKNPLIVDNTNGRVGVGKSPTVPLDITGLVTSDSTFSSTIAAGSTGFKVIEGALFGLDGSSNNFLKADTTTHGVVLKSNVANSGTNAALLIDTVNSLTGSTNLLTLSIAGTSKWKFGPTTLTFPDGTTMTSGTSGGGGSFNNPVTIETDLNEGIPLSVISNDDGSNNALLVRQKNENGFAGLTAFLSPFGASGDGVTTGDRVMFGLNTYGNTYTTVGLRNSIVLNQHNHTLIFDGVGDMSYLPIYFYANGQSLFQNQLTATNGIQFGDASIQYTAATNFWTYSDGSNIQHIDSAVDMVEIRGASVGGSPSISTGTSPGDTIVQSQSGATMIPQRIATYNSPSNNYLLFVDDGWNLNYGSTIIFADGHIEVVPDPTNYGALYGGPNYWLGVGCPMNSTDAFYGIPQDANSAAIGYAKCWSFNWVTKVFTPLTDCPYTTVAAGACNTGQNSILVPGAIYGTGGDAHGTPGWFLYNISGNSWSLANTSGAPASDKCLQMLLMDNGNILCLGYRGTFGTYDTYEYDPVGDTWIAIANSNLGFDPGSAAGAGPFMNGVKACSLDNGMVFTMSAGPVVTGAGYDGDIGGRETYNSAQNGQGGGGWSSFQGFPVSADYIDPDAHEHQWVWAAQTNNHWGIAGYGGQNFYFYLGNNPKDYYCVTFSAIYNIFDDEVVEYVSIMNRAGDSTTTIGANLEGEHPSFNVNKFGYFDETIVGGGPHDRIVMTDLWTTLEGQNDNSAPEVIVWSGTSKTTGPLMSWTMGGSTPDTGTVIAQLYNSFFLLNGQFQLNNNYATGFVWAPDITNAMQIGNASYFTYAGLSAPNGLANYVRGIDGITASEGADPTTLNARLVFLPLSSPAVDVNSVSTLKAELLLADNPPDVTVEVATIDALAWNKNTRTISLFSAIKTKGIHNPNPASGHANTLTSLFGIHVLGNTNPDSQPLTNNAGIWIETQASGSTNEYALGYGDHTTPTTPLFAVDKNGKSRHHYLDNTGTPGNNTSNTITGKCKIAAAASQVVVTNSRVTSSTIIEPTINQATADVTLTQLTWTATAGSFTIFGNAVATAAVQIAWTIRN